MRDFLVSAKEPIVINYRVNAGHIPLTHCVQDPTTGGGRIIGEICHFVDLVQFLTSSEAIRVYAAAVPESRRYSGDNLVIALSLRDGSVGTITYIANGDRRVGKETIEASCGGKSAILDEFRKLELAGNGRRRILRNRLRQDKGHEQECRAFAQAVRDGSSAISFESICATTLATFAVHDSLRSGMPVEISLDSLFESTPQQRAKTAAI